MANTTTTPWMLMVLPVPQEEVGPEWAQELIDALTDRLDPHDHTTGNGQKVPPAGLDIIDDLSFQGSDLVNYRAMGVAGVVLAALAVAPAGGDDLREVYSLEDGELYFRDAAGNDVRITLSGALDASTFGGISGMGGTDATVVYSDVSKTFAFSQDAGVPAKMDFGRIAVRDDSVASGHEVTLKAEDGLAGDVVITLFNEIPADPRLVRLKDDGVLDLVPAALPAAKSAVTIDQNGDVAVDNVAPKLAAIGLAATPTPAGSDLTLYVDTLNGKASLKDAAGASFPVRMIVANKTSGFVFSTVETIVAGGKLAGTNGPQSSFKIPGNTLKVGSVLEFDVLAACSSTVANNTVVRVRIGANGTTADTAVWTFTNVAAVAGATGANFRMRVRMTVTAIGAAANFGGAGSMEIYSDKTTEGISANQVNLGAGAAATANFDSTADLYAELTIQSGGATTSFNITEGTAEIL